MRIFSSPVNLHFAVIINISSSASLQTGTRLRRKKTAASLLTVLVRAIKKTSSLRSPDSRKDIQHLPRFSFASENADYVVYPRSAQAYADAGTSTWVNQKGYTTFAWIFTCVSKCCLCYISKKRSGIRGCRDFNLGEPERIYNICLDFHLRFKMLIMLYIPEALRHTRMPGLQPG